MVNMSKLVGAFIGIIILIVILAQFYGTVSPDLEAGLANSSSYSNTENETGTLPLSGLLAPSGIVGLVIGAAVLIILIGVGLAVMNFRKDD